MTRTVLCALIGASVSRSKIPAGFLDLLPMQLYVHNVKKNGQKQLERGSFLIYLILPPIDTERFRIKNNQWTNEFALSSFNHGSTEKVVGKPRQSSSRIIQAKIMLV